MAFLWKAPHRVTRIPTGRFGAMSPADSLSMQGREHDFARLGICHSERSNAEGPVTASLPTNTERRLNGGEDRGALSQPSHRPADPPRNLSLGHRGHECLLRVGLRATPPPIHRRKAAAGGSLPISSHSLMSRIDPQATFVALAPSQRIPVRSGRLRHTRSSIAGTINADRLTPCYIDVNNAD